MSGKAKNNGVKKQVKNKKLKKKFNLNLLFLQCAYYIKSTFIWILRIDYHFKKVLIIRGLNSDSPDKVLIVDFIVETPFLFIIFFHDKTDYIVIFLLRGFFILLFWFAIYIRTTMLLLILSDWILIFLIFHQPLIIIIRLSLFFYITSQNIGETDVATERSLKKVVCRTDALVANSIVSKISQLSICFFFQNF